MKRAILTCVITTALCVAFVRADNWPGWRGPNNNLISPESNLPIKWSESENVLWKFPLPPVPTKAGSGATPAIWGDNIFVPSREGKDVVLICLGTDGKLRWKSKVGAADRQNFKVNETNDASNSPSTDGKHVYAFTGSGDFVCFDFNGKEVWRYDVVERYGGFSTYHGLHFTPLLEGDRLYMAMLSERGHWVIAIDKETGKDVWKVARPTDAKGESRQAYASPFVWRNDKETCLVVVGCDCITGHEMSDGKELWRLTGVNPKKAQNWRIVPSPVGSKDFLVVCGGRSPGPLLGLKPGAKGTFKTDSPDVLWSINVAPDVPTPLIHDGLVYLCKAEDGMLTCVEGLSGKQHYSKPLDNIKYRSSPVYADGRIYCTSFDGHFHVVKAGKDFQLLAENVLDDNFSASPAISGGRIYLRGWKSLYAIGNK